MNTQEKADSSRNYIYIPSTKTFSAPYVGIEEFNRLLMNTLNYPNTKNKEKIEQIEQVQFKILGILRQEIQEIIGDMWDYSNVKKYIIDNKLSEEEALLYIEKLILRLGDVFEVIQNNLIKLDTGNVFINKTIKEIYKEFCIKSSWLKPIEGLEDIDFQEQYDIPFGLSNNHKKGVNNSASIETAYSWNYCKIFIGDVDGSRFNHNGKPLDILTEGYNNILSVLKNLLFLVGDIKSLSSLYVKSDDYKESELEKSKKEMEDSHFRLLNEFFV